jgi:hypothetical protein
MVGRPVSSFERSTSTSASRSGPWQPRNTSLGRSSTSTLMGKPGLGHATAESLSAPDEHGAAGAHVSASVFPSPYNDGVAPKHPGIAVRVCRGFESLLRHAKFLQTSD